MENLIKPEPKREEITTEILTADQLKRTIYQGGSLPQDNRFLSTDEGGVFKYFFVQDLINPTKSEMYYPVVKVDGVIAAMGKLEKDPYKKDNFWLSFVSVDPEYQGKHLATKVCEEVMQFSVQHKNTLELSFFTEVGYLKLSPVIHRLVEKYDVKLIGEDRKGF